MQWQEGKIKSSRKRGGRFVCFWRAKVFSDNEHFQCICICLGSGAKTLQSVARTKIIFLSLPGSKCEKHHITQSPRERKIRHCQSTNSKKKMRKGRSWVYMFDHRVLFFDLCFMIHLHWCKYFTVIKGSKWQFKGVEINLYWKLREYWEIQLIYTQARIYITKPLTECLLWICTLVLQQLTMWKLWWWWCNYFFHNNMRECNFVSAKLLLL